MQDYGELLAFVRTQEPYSHWTETSTDHYRDYRDDPNPHLQLSRFGLYDFKEGRAVKTLPAVARECGAPLSLVGEGIGGKVKRSTRILSPAAEEFKDVITPEQQKKQAALMRVLADKRKWKRDHAPLILKYFEGARAIPRKWISPWTYYRLGCVVQTWKERTEIIMPLWDSQGGLVQLLKIEVDKDSGEKIGKGKRLLLSADRDRAIMLGASESNRVMIVEGIEDGLSLQAALEYQGVEEEGRVPEAGCDWAICVSCGAGNFVKTWELIKDYEQRIVLLDNDGHGLCGPSCTGSLALGDRVLRYLPAITPQATAEIRSGSKADDANSVLMWGGVQGLSEWLRATHQPDRFVTTTEIKHAVEETKIAEDGTTGSGNQGTEHHPLSERGAAGYFSKHYGGRVRVSQDHVFWVWNEKAWEQDNEDQVYEWVGALRNVYQQLAGSWEEEGKHEDDVMACFKFADSLGNYQKQRNVVALVKKLPELKCQVDDFDRHPHLLNTPSGIVDLRVGKLLPHDPKFMCSKTTRVAFNPRVTESEAWNNFLSHAAGENNGWIPFFQTAIGYSLTGYTREKCMFFAWGVSNSGKSTFSVIMTRILGQGKTGYSAVCDIKLLENDPRSNNMNAVDYKKANLPGVRMLFPSESGKQEISPQIVKDITGSDFITARRPAKEEFTFSPVAKVWVRGNNPPDFKGADEAIINRVRSLDFLHPFAGEDLNTHFMEDIQQSESDLESILAWAVLGAVMWHKNDGLPSYESTSNTIAMNAITETSVNGIMDKFTEDCCVLVPDARVKALDFHREFLAFIQRNSFRNPGRGTFLIELDRRLTAMGAVHIYPQNKSTYLGVDIDEGDFEKLGEPNLNEDDDSDGTFH